MKKISLLFLSSFLAFYSFSQVTIGLRLSPVMCFNRVKDLDNSDNFNFSNNGSGMRFAFGPSFDFKIGENYAFSTGAWYLSSRAGMTIKTEYSPLASFIAAELGSAGIPNINQKDIVSLQSVQIPVTFKVYTNELTTNLKLYFQLGGLATINFYEKEKETTPALVGAYQNKYDLFDISLYMATGVNYKIGESNALFAGLYYNRGLMNIMNGNTEPNTGKKYKDVAKYNMDMVGIEVGVTF